MRRLAIVFSVPALFAFYACGDDLGGGDDEPFDTFQGCFDDHHGGDEGFDVQTAIKICCLDHPIGTPPIGPNVVCGATVDTCKTFVAANLAQASATADEIMTACTGYVADRNK